MFRNLAVVLQSLFASGLLPRGGERNIADFEQLGSGEKQHAGRIVIERIHQTTLVEDDDPEPDLLRFNRAGEAGGSGPDDQHVGARLGMRTGFSFRQSFKIFRGKKVRHGLETAALVTGDEGRSETDDSSMRGIKPARPTERSRRGVRGRE